MKEVAAHLKTDPRSPRAFLRRTERGTRRGTRYSWPSLADAAVKKIYYELGVHYLVGDLVEVALDFRVQLDNPNPTGDRYRLYPVDGDPIDVHDE